jgi:hypothetical protein
VGSKLTSAIFWTGAVLCLVGIFLPWEVQGDPVNLTVYGIQIIPRLDDHGGFELLMLTGFHILATLRSPQPPEKAGLGFLLSAVLLVLSTLYFTGRWFLHNLEYTGTLAAPSLGIGLVLVLAGSVLLVSVAMTKI